MSNNLTIRPVQEEDMPFLLNFEQHLIAYERPYNCTFIEAPFQYYNLPQLIQDKDTIVLVAVDGHQPIASGYATIRNGKPYEAFGRYAYLGFMYVSPAYRGQGINQQMMQELANWTLARGITEMRLQVYEENRSAVSAYKKAGFKPLALEMRADARDLIKPI